MSESLRSADRNTHLKIIAVALLAGGVAYFRSTEKAMADLV